jgi:hypothetical protein
MALSIIGQGGGPLCKLGVDRAHSDALAERIIEKKPRPINPHEVRYHVLTPSQTRAKVEDNLSLDAERGENFFKHCGCKGSSGLSGQKREPGITERAARLFYR